MTECDKNARFTCDWIFNILVVLSDGKVVCGCADPHGKRPLGNLNKNSLYEIWYSDKVKQIRRELNQGHSCFCHDCGLKRILRDDEDIPQNHEHMETLSRIFLEPTVLCNLNCFEAVCRPDSGILKSRERQNFPVQQFKTLMDEIGSKLSRLDFFNYGEPFVHPQAVDMIEYIKGKYPHIYLYCSTNGLRLNREKIKRITQSGLDEITFSVDGCDQESYVRYRQGGDFETVLNLISIFVEERNKLGREVPFINWRYILFKWNDSKRKMKRAKNLATKIGVDRFSWEITDHPPEAKSEKYQVGTSHWKKIYYEIWDTSQIGNAIKKKRFFAELKIMGPPIFMMVSGEPLELNVRIKNIGGARWLKTAWSGRRWIRLGAQLHDQDKKMIDLNYARAFLNRDIIYKEKDILTIILPAINESGDYYLKFDMVSEGNDWFENGGSPVIWVPLQVRPS